MPDVDDISAKLGQFLPKSGLFKPSVPTPSTQEEYRHAQLTAKREELIVDLLEALKKNSATGLFETVLDNYQFFKRSVYTYHSSPEADPFEQCLIEIINNNDYTAKSMKTK